MGEGENRYPLEAFGLIAKEGRKYGLTICIATQRPRDIPEDVLSQMGTLIVHRLTNDDDRRVVERASGDIDKAAAAFLPTLGPGEAAVIGVDFAMPVQVQVLPPRAEPESQGPDYQRSWSGHTADDLD
jgi:DNA helicase HerA-like ATPase